MNNIEMMKLALQNNAIREKVTEHYKSYVNMAWNAALEKAENNCTESVIIIDGQEVHEKIITESELKKLKRSGK